MMEEVGSHDDVEEQGILASSVGISDMTTISDALQEAAQPLVDTTKDFLAATTSAPPATRISPGPTGMAQTPSTQNNFRPIAPHFPTMPGSSMSVANSPHVPSVPSLSEGSAGTAAGTEFTATPTAPTWTASSTAPTFSAISTLPTNISTPTRPPSYLPATPGLVGVSPSVNQPTMGSAAPPPPPTGGFVPAHGVVTATPGKHQSTLPLAPPSSLASHLLTPTTVDQSGATEFSSYSPQQPAGLVSGYNAGPPPPQPAAYTSYTQPMATYSAAPPNVAADYGQGMMQSSYEASGGYGTGVRVEPAPPSPQRSDRFFGWLPGSGLMHKMIEKTKSSVETVITTLDPGMKEVIYSGGSVNIVVTSSKEVKIGAIRTAFQSVFGRATVTGMDSQPNIAPQPVGYSSGVRGAEERIENLRQAGVIDEQQAVISIENFIVELLPDRWFDVGCVLLKDPRHDIDLMTFTQATPVPAECVCMAQDATSADYPLRWSGLAMTVGQAVQQQAPHVDHSDWHAYYTGVSRRDMLTAAARSLAGMYRTQLPSGYVL